MFKRLFVVFALVAATAVVSTPARATTLTVNAVNCWIYHYTYYNGYYTCVASVSGGTGSYVSYTWNITSTRGNYSLTTTSNTINRTCFRNPNSSGFPPETFTVNVTVTDSAGARASGRSHLIACDGGA